MQPETKFPLFCGYDSPFENGGATMTCAVFRCISKDGTEIVLSHIIFPPSEKRESWVIEMGQYPRSTRARVINIFQLYLENAITPQQFRDAWKEAQRWVEIVGNAAVLHQPLPEEESHAS